MSSGKWRPFCLGLNVLNEQTVGESKGNTLAKSQILGGTDAP